MDKPITSKTERLVVIFLLLLGAGLRFIQFGDVPPGLYHDEAQNGLDALSILDGNLPFYFEANNGREPIFIYLIALSVGFLGRTPMAVRLPSFYAGFLTLAAAYHLAQVLFDRRMARYTLAILAVTFWHIHLSRVAFRSSLLPLFTALYLSWIVKAIQQKNPTYWLAGGVLYGLSWYTYIAARFTPVALAVLLIYIFSVRKLWQNYVNNRQIFYAITKFTLAALVVLIPLGLYTITHPDIVLSRSGQVSIFSSEINGGDLGGTFLRHVLRATGMFIFRGDRIWRHNLSYRPVWTTGLSVAFIIGLGVAFAGFNRKPAAALSLIWTSVMLLPTLLAEDAPHYLRAVGVLPTAALIPAMGLCWLQSRLEEWVRRRSAHFKRLLLRIRISRTIPWLLVASSSFLSIYDYYVTYAQSPQTYHWFEGGPTAMAKTINALTGQGWDGHINRQHNTESKIVCIDPILWNSWASVPFLVQESSICLLPLSESPSNQGIVFVVWPYDDWHQRLDLYLPHPSYLFIIDGPSAQGDLDPEPYRIAVFVHSEAMPPVPPYIAQFDNGLGLRAALVETLDKSVIVNLWWDTAVNQNTPATVFVHYLRDGERIAQDDSQPGDNQLPITLWKPGDLILDRHILEGVTADIESDRLRIGVYDSETGDSIHVVDENLNVHPWFETNVILSH